MYDIVCLCETKTDKIDEANISIDGYKIFYHHRSHCKEKSGGIAILVKDKFSNCVTPLKSNDNENVLWCVIDQALTGQSFIIGAVYIPPENSNYVTGDEIGAIENEILDLTSDLGVPILLVGDMNARTGSLSDYVIIEKCILEKTGFICENATSELLCDEDTLIKSNVTPHRVNMDKKSDNRGRKLIEMCKNTGLLIVNGRIGADSRVGHTTCKNVSTVDYCIASLSLFEIIVNMKVDLFDSCLSDVHNPIFIELNRTNCIIKDPGSPKSAPKIVAKGAQNSDPSYKITGIRARRASSKMHLI